MARIPNFLDFLSGVVPNSSATPFMGMNMSQIMPPTQLGQNLAPSQQPGQATQSAVNGGTPSPSDYSYFQGMAPFAQKYGTSYQSPFAPPPPSPTGNAPQPPTSGQYAPPTAGGSMANVDPGVAKYADLIKQVANQIGVPAVDLASIMTIESHGDPNAHSGAGAEGLMQVMPFHFQPGDNPYDPFTNIKRGAEVFKAALARDSDPLHAAEIYFGGPGTDVGGQTGEGYKNAFAAALSKNAAFNNIANVVNNYIQSAEQFLGRPYVWGGSDPVTGFDCSGLTQWAYAQNGKQLPRTAQQQFNATQRVDTSQLQPGDLVFFQGTYNTPDQITHVGIYTGNGRMVSAASNGITEDDITSGYWAQHYAGAGRIQ